MTCTVNPLMNIFLHVSLTWKWLLRPLLTISRTPSICRGNTSKQTPTSLQVSYQPCNRSKSTCSDKHWLLTSHSPLHLRWHSSKAPGLGRESSVSCCPRAASAVDMTEDTAGIPNPGGTVNPGTPLLPEGGGGGEPAAKTLPILPERWYTGTWSDSLPF